MLEVIKEIRIKNSYLEVQLLGGDEIRILDRSLVNSVNVCLVSELPNLISALQELSSNE